MSVDIADGRFRVSAGRKHVGSWPLERIEAERASIYKFVLNIEGELFDFYPEDPSTFSDAVGAVIDLTEPKGRFGLKQRIEKSTSAS